MGISRRGFFGFLGGMVAALGVPKFGSANDLGSKLAKVKVSCGPLSTSFNGKTVGEIRKAIANSLFIPEGAPAVLSNLTREWSFIPDDFVLRNGDKIKFLRLAGRIGNR
jgi:hypothetical protein